KLEKEKLEKEKLEKEKLEKEKLEKEKLEKEKLEKEKLEKERLEKAGISPEITNIADAIAGRQVKEKVIKQKSEIIIPEMPSVEQLAEQAELSSFAEKAKARELENKKTSEKEKEIQRIKLEQEAEKSLIELRKKKEETDEEKLRRITNATFDTEEAISNVLEEKIPFEQRKKEIELEIERAEKKLDLILERKERIEEVKKTIEDQENSSKSVDEKRTFEKERWKIEDQRNDVGLEQEEKEDEIKSLKAQLNECSYNFEKIVSKERELNLELEILRRDREDILLEQQKRVIQTDLEKIETEAFAIKDKMFENTKLKNELDRKLSDIKNREKLSEEEIKILEKRTDAAGTENEIRALEQQRKSAERARRDVETERWKIEDSLSKAEKERDKLKERYQLISGEIKVFRDKVSDINEKKEQNIKIQISQISDRVKNKEAVEEEKIEEDAEDE
ncbi:MAG: hypothetical protein WCX30_00885, partial [Candidatus Paceibacterota bacterium]